MISLAIFGGLCIQQEEGYIEVVYWGSQRVKIERISIGGLE
jgi:hypothetical protein